MLRTIVNSISRFSSKIFQYGKPEASGTDTGVKLPSLDEIGVVCFKIYLFDHLNKLKSGSISNPLVIARDIASVYNCLFAQHIHTSAGSLQCFNLTCVSINIENCLFCSTLLGFGGFTY